MKHQEFWMRATSLIVAVGALGVYQANALQWQREKEANQLAVQRAQAHNTAAQQAASDTAGSYQDGTYTGNGEGFGGTVSVEVIVSCGKLTEIAITSAGGEDAAYLDRAKQIIDSMLAAQSADVDTISGATFSSTGIKTAVQQALEGAKK